MANEFPGEKTQKESGLWKVNQTLLVNRVKCESSKPATIQIKDQEIIIYPFLELQFTMPSQGEANQSWFLKENKIIK